MTRQTVTLFAVFVLMIALMAGSAFSRAAYDKDNILQKRRAQLVDKYGLPEAERVRLDNAFSPEWQPPDFSVPTSREGERSSLGMTSIASISRGLTIGYTYEDWQYFSKGRRVDSRGTPDIHFTFMDKSLAGSNQGYLYNVYDPVNGSWPHLIEIGCRVQTSETRGWFPNLDVTADGLAVLAGYDDAGGPSDNHIFYQPGQFSCFWGGGAIVPQTTYNTDFQINPLKFLQQVTVEVQEKADTLVTHIIGVEDWGEDDYWSGDDGIVMRALVYCRKLGAGSGVPEDWTAHTICTSWVCGDITASKKSGKVAVFFPQPTADGIAEDQINFDADMYVRLSSNYGESWDDKVNVTNYSPLEDHSRVWWEVNGLYDTDDSLHCVFNATPVGIDPYNQTPSPFADFDASMWHWSNRTGILTRIHNAEWGINIETLCGFGGNSTMNVSRFSITECAGRLYVTWMMWNDYFTDPPIIDDCVSGGEDTFHSANGELYMSVSSTLDGSLWDAYRNLTNSFTPGCDSAAGEGECANDHFGSASRYGMGGMDTLNWPGDEYYDPTGTYDRDSCFHILYLEDKWPGAVARQDNLATSNPVKWLRIPCVDPIEAPQIFVDPDEVGYPDWVHQGEAVKCTITVRNDGNVPLTVDSVVAREEYGPAGWLDVSDISTPFQVGAGTGYNEEPFEFTVNALNHSDPGTSTWLLGDVWVFSDADNKDSAQITAFYVIADTVQPLPDPWPKVTTNPAKGGEATNEYVSLSVSNHGEFGEQGIGEHNMDYIGSGLECDDSANVYLYDGGPFLFYHEGDTLKFNTSLFTLGFANEEDFKPLADVPGWSEGTTGIYDTVWTGTFVNGDTTIGLNKIYYAPRNHDENPTFIVSKMQVYSYDGAPHNQLTIGELVDWDIPADDGADNLSYESEVANMVYMQGSDTLKDPDNDCQDNVDRYGGTAFLGWHTNTEFNADACANNPVFYGHFGNRFHEWYDDSLAAENYQYMLDTLLANPGLNADDSLDDQGVFATFVSNYSLAGSDTLTFYTVHATVREATPEEKVAPADLEATIAEARLWYTEFIRGEECLSCCREFRGDVDLEGACTPEEQDTDISDLTNMIDHLFINYTPVCCVEEGDVSPWIKGDPPDGAIDIGDLTDMIDHLFINYPPMPSCQYP